MVADSRSTTADLLDEIEQILRRHLMLRTAEYTVIALWVLHTYCFQHFRYTPYLNITSPEKGSGKTTVLDLLFLLAKNAKRSDSCSPAVLYRLIEKWKPTLLLDEIDATIKGDKESAEAIRGVLNSGFKRTGTVTRCTGKNRDDIAEFNTFCPKVLSGIGRHWDTVHDRSIVIKMRRLAPDESVEPIDEELLERIVVPLRERLAKWASASKAKFLLRPARLEGLRNQRQQDIVLPLLTAANVAGSQWTERARSALTEIFASEPAQDQSPRIALLSDIRGIFKSRDVDKMFTSDLLSALKETEGAQWSDWNKGRGITSHELSRILKEFEIGPRSLRIGCENKKGYSRDTFADAFTRYLPAIEEDQ